MKNNLKWREEENSKGSDNWRAEERASEYVRESDGKAERWRYRWETNDYKFRLSESQMCFLDTETQRLVERKFYVLLLWAYFSLFTILDLINSTMNALSDIWDLRVGSYKHLIKMSITRFTLSLFDYFVFRVRSFDATTKLENRMLFANCFFKPVVTIQQWCIFVQKSL